MSAIKSILSGDAAANEPITITTSLETPDAARLEGVVGLLKAEGKIADRSALVRAGVLDAVEQAEALYGGAAKVAALCEEKGISTAPKRKPRA